MRVFISHTARDSGTARALARALKERNIDAILGGDIESGSDVSREINSAMSSSDAIIALLSKYSFSSEWVRRELDEALFNDKYKDVFFPVLLSSKAGDLARLPWVLQKIHHLRITPAKSHSALGKEIASKFVEFIKAGR